MNYAPEAIRLGNHRNSVRLADRIKAKNDFKSKYEDDRWWKNFSTIERVFGFLDEELDNE